MVSLVGLLMIAMVLLLAVVVVAAVIIGLFTGSRRKADQDSNPNFAPCPGCQKLVSIHAASCPDCGHALKS